MLLLVHIMQHACAAGRKDGRPPTAKRTGKDKVEGVDPMLGLGVLCFKVCFMVCFLDFLEY
jgi:hypothetical protein